jgi:hypothetical protein
VLNRRRETNVAFNSLTKACKCIPSRQCWVFRMASLLENVVKYFAFLVRALNVANDKEFRPGGDGKNALKNQLGVALIPSEWRNNNTIR